MVTLLGTMLPYLTACLFATVLEDSITTMRILVECNNSLRVTKAMADMEELLAVKFSVPPALTVDPLAKVDPRDLGRAEYKLHKLESDRKLLIEVFTSTTKPGIAQTDATLTGKFASSGVHVKTVTYDTDVAIEKLRTQVEDAALNAEIQSRYIENWQRSRTEQHRRNIYGQETPPADAIETYKQRFDHEQRVHSEFELLNNIIINETLEKVENWMNKYDKDMEGVDLKIQIMRTDYETTLEKRWMLENTLEGHATLMQDWLAFKAERERIRQYRERMTKAAVMVQAWWRGLLVRRKLGPYKEKPKKKQPPKK
ncbi:unnamed protein product, partial [Iphiclides podalirius]